LFKRNKVKVNRAVTNFNIRFQINATECRRREYLGGLDVGPVTCLSGFGAHYQSFKCSIMTTKRGTCMLLTYEVYRNHWQQTRRVPLSWCKTTACQSYASFIVPGEQTSMEWTLAPTKRQCSCEKRTRLRRETGTFHWQFKGKENKNNGLSSKHALHSASNLEL
jgi:hypothetical protein